MRRLFRPEALLVVALTVASCSANNQLGVQRDGGAGGSGTGGVRVGAGGSAVGGGVVGDAGAAGSIGGGGRGSVGIGGGSATGGAGGAETVGVGGESAGAGGSVGTGGGGAAGSAGTAGAAAGGIQPLALVVDPATNRFVAYNRNGQIVHDYLSRLDLGSGFTGRDIIANGAQLAWDRGTSVGNFIGPSGLADPLEPSRILIRADTTPVTNTKVRMLTVDNQSASDVTVNGAWRFVDLSPHRGYLLTTGNMTASGPNMVGVTRISDGATLFREQVVQAALARDDVHFVYVPMDRSIPVRVMDLATRTETSPALTQPAFATQPGVWVELVATTNDRAIILTEGAGKFGRLLWAMSWQANVDRLGADMPEYVDEYFQAFSPSGGKVVWSRETNGANGKPFTYVGAYQMDFATKTTGAWTGTTFDCFERPNQVGFNLMSGTTERVIQSCNCGTGACTNIATISVPESGWVPMLNVSAKRSVIVVNYGWSRDGMPAAYPEVKILSATGQQLASLAYGTADVDTTGQLVLLREWSPTGARRVGIVDIASGAITWIGTPASYTIVYE